jgi:methylthioribulose-1-phosphate dehydratase
MDEAAAKAALIEAGRDFARRGWLEATSGNLSCRVEGGRMAVTVSGCGKGALSEGDIVTVTLDEALPAGVSAEAPLHVSLYRRDPAIGAVLHVHSPTATLVSMEHAAAGAVVIAGFEMLKALDGIDTHEATLAMPVFANDQDIPGLARRVEERLEAEPGHVGYLIAGHGLYGWGRTMADARRHVEAFDFLLGCVREQGRMTR